MSFMSVEEGERKKIGAAAALIDTFQAFQEAPKNKVSFKGNLCASCKSLLLLLGSFGFVDFLESFVPGNQIGGSQIQLIDLHH